ncbi:SDR family oxidoreductase [Jannaschia sp. Os4]|uniref:SDR family oxidoreductase n=1 Tax=Jannaschia sp. Os4 TaxID=2807617 RepID=UPI0031B61941
MTRRVVVTAGGAGIGAALVRRFAADGARVAYCDLAPGDAPDGVLGVEADVADEASMDGFLARAHDHLGGVDVLCANAGTGGPAAPIEDMAYGDWRACLDVNLGGAFLACRWAARAMKGQGSGCILLTSSTAGQWGIPSRSPYVAAKWGVLGLTKTLAAELGPHGIRVNAICPGAVEGERMERVVAMEAAARGADPEAIRALYAEGTSMRRWVTAEDIAATAAFLASDAARTISGQALAVDGNTERVT